MTTSGDYWLTADIVEQLLGLVWKGGRIDHAAGEHDDWANAAAGVVARVAGGPRSRLTPIVGGERVRVDALDAGAPVTAGAVAAVSAMEHSGHSDRARSPHRRS